MSNREAGSRFETDFCTLLSDNGFWAHNMAQNAAGQPFDVIAAKDGNTYVIDCKVCANDVFKLSRIEPNQEMAMSLWHETGNGTGWFALELRDKSIYMIAYKELKSLRVTRHTLTLKDIKEQGYTLEEWLG